MLAWRSALGLALSTLAQWAACAGAVLAGLPATAGFALGCALGVAHLRAGSGAAWSVKTLRSGLFPLSYCALWATQEAPSWIWGAMALAGALTFPRLDKASAPLWRSPAGVSTSLGVALAGLEARPSRALDPGCGMGDGMAALRAALPRAEVVGIEAAWLPWMVARWRFGKAARMADMWSESWRGFDLVYLFLRPEAMEQARAKLALELEGEALVASLDFEFESRGCVDEREAAPGRVLRIYRVCDLRDAQTQLGGEAEGGPLVRGSGPSSKAKAPEGGAEG